MRPQFAFQLFILVEALYGWCAIGRTDPEVWEHVEALHDYLGDQCGDGFFVLPSDWNGDY